MLLSCFLVFVLSCFRAFLLSCFFAFLLSCLLSYFLTFLLSHLLSHFLTFLLSHLLAECFMVDKRDNRSCIAAVPVRSPTCVRDRENPVWKSLSYTHTTFLYPHRVLVSKFVQR